MLSTQKFNEETSELIDTVDQMNLTHFYSVFHLAGTQCKFFLAAHGTFSNTDHVLKHKS
jgi:hypothetical protein